ncbi:type II toxin-antitoxin system RelE/ParE family toxin [Amphritea sp. HPY]|uniref:type II toxin-antitoxin system RelE/ParE family toxin n=1 Tax=Amphritea sp. HPY TaxID=3421652 RepID=UPI003D7DDE1A
MKYSFTDKAEKDLEGIIDFTRDHWGKLQASEYIDGLVDTARNIAQYPAIGKQRLRLSPDVYSFPYRKHILYYIHATDRIIIIRVLHASMDPHIHIK